MPPGTKKPTRDSPALMSAVDAFDKLAIETEDPVVALIKLMQSKRLSAADLKDAKENKLNSFSSAEYSVLTPVFGLSQTEGYEEFDKMTVPRIAFHGMSRANYSSLVGKPRWLSVIPHAITMRGSGITF